MPTPIGADLDEEGAERHLANLRAQLEEMKTRHKARQRFRLFVLASLVAVSAIAFLAGLV